MHGRAIVLEALRLRDEEGLGAVPAARRLGLRVGTVRDWYAGKLPRHSRTTLPNGDPLPPACPACGHDEHRFRPASSRVRVSAGSLPRRWNALAAPPTGVPASNLSGQEVSRHRRGVRIGDPVNDAGERGRMPAYAEQLLPGVWLFPGLALPLPTARARDEAHASDMAGGLATGARRAVAGRASPRPDPLGWVSVHQSPREGRFMVRPSLRLRQSVNGHHEHLLHRVRQARPSLDGRLSEGRHRDRADLRVPQSRRRADGRVHRAEELIPPVPRSFRSLEPST